MSTEGIYLGMAPWGKHLYKNKSRYNITGPGVVVGTENDSEEVSYRSENWKTVF